MWWAFPLDPAVGQNGLIRASRPPAEDHWSTKSDKEVCVTASNYLTAWINLGLN